MDLFSAHVPQVGPACRAALDLPDEYETAHECEAAKAALNTLSTLRKAIDTERKDAKRPHLDANKAIESEAKRLFAPLDTAIQTIKTSLASFDERERRKLDEEKAKQRAAVTAANDHGMVPDLTVPNVDTAPVATPSVHTRSRKVLVITDKAQIPLEYMVPDEVAIKRALAAGEEVPGAELREERVVVSG